MSKSFCVAVYVRLWCERAAISRDGLGGKSSQVRHPGAPYTISSVGPVSKCFHTTDRGRTDKRTKRNRRMSDAKRGRVNCTKKHLLPEKWPDFVDGRDEEIVIDTMHPPLSKAKSRAPASSRALRLVRGVVQRCYNRRLRWILDCWAAELCVSAGVHVRNWRWQFLKVNMHSCFNL